MSRRLCMTCHSELCPPGESRCDDCSLAWNLRRGVKPTPARRAGLADPVPGADLSGLLQQRLTDLGGGG